MAQHKLPTVDDPESIKYSNLLGVDYRADPTEVDRKRSPDMVNMISDMGGDPIKRPGYRSVGNAYDGMVTASGETWGVRRGTSTLIITKLTLGGTSIVEDLTNAIVISGHTFSTVQAVYGYQHYVIVLTPIGIIKADIDASTYEMTGTDTGMMSVGNIGETAPVNSDIIPETTIALKPDGTNGASYEEKNLFSIYQRATYLGDGTSTEYVIPAYSKMGTWVKCEILNSDGDWETTSAYSLGTSTSVTGKSLDGTSTITSNIVDAKVTFSTAPSTPVVSGEPNVRITFAPYSLDQIDNVNRGYYNKTFCNLLASGVSTIFSSRLFISDDESAYYSDISQQLRMGDNHWFDVDNIIVSFTRTSSYLAVITKDNGRNTIFLASEITESTTSETAFAVKPSNAGVGAITGKCTGVLNDEPVFLATTGIYGILTNLNSEKYAVNRSGRVNRKLCKETNLQNAVGIPYNGYYYIAINGKMYVLDSRHKDTQKSGENSYECYYFDSMPTVKSMFVVNNKMYFCSATDTYGWNDDLDDEWKYLDNAVYHDANDDDDEYWTGDIVKARWSSTYDDDNYPQNLKTLQKRGTMITVKPYSSSSCDITLTKDGDESEYIGHFPITIDSFANINFNAGMFTFQPNTVATDAFTKKKIKKYKRLQITVENNYAEPFGITSIVKTYLIGNYAKR